MGSDVGFLGNSLIRISGGHRLKPSPARSKIQWTNGRATRIGIVKTRTASKSRYWSQRVTRNSNALDLEPNIFNSPDPRRIAGSLKHSAEVSHRRKGTPYQSAMSMLNFYINRAGRSLPQKQKRVLERAKSELRAAFGRGGDGSPLIHG
jgi:hypothetical protein